jgi:hypothetical protein
MKRRNKTRLPKMTVLAYSAAELQRWTEATERIAAAAASLWQVAERLELLVTRSEAARKAYNTRRRKHDTASADVNDPKWEDTAAGKEYFADRQAQSDYDKAAADPSTLIV